MKQKPQYERWDKKNGLKGVTVYLEPVDKRLLKKAAKEADKSVALYLRRLVETHLHNINQPPSSIG